jgi:hypothetical protein
MRSDMYKVIVERPRTGKYGYECGARLRDDFEGPSRLGMRAGYGRRGLNENLSPLRRFLHKQIGRPWNKVFGEISAGIDRRNTVQQHIHQHIEDFIATQVQWRGAELVDLKNEGWPNAASLRQPLYVDPDNGLIRPNKQYRSWHQERRAELDLEREKIAARRRVLDHNRWLMLIDGEWYEVRIAPLPEPVIEETRVNGKLRVKYIDRHVFDVVLKKRVRKWADNGPMQEYFYGVKGIVRVTDIYAESKRQLSKREMIAHGLLKK